MSAVPAQAMLAAWDSGASQSAPERALTLLAAAWPEHTRVHWLHLPIGARDRQLLVLRERLFGTRIDALAACPACAERLELAFTTSQVAIDAPATLAAVEVDVAGYRLSCRLPDSADLLAASAAPAGQGGTLLLERCLTSALNDGLPVAPALLPPAVRDALERALLEADPQAEVQVALDCPGCGHGWTIHFDVLAYLWSELDDWAGRVLREVHDLASAYGWRERDILALSATRRQWYLDLIAGQRQ